MAVLRNCFKMMPAVSSEGDIYEKAPHFREGLLSGADGARTHDLGRDRPAF